MITPPETIIIAQKEQLKADIDKHCILRGNFTLASGLKSKYYFDCKQGLLVGSVLTQITTEMMNVIYLNFHHLPTAVGGVTIGGALLVGAMLEHAQSNQFLQPTLGTVVRDKPKDHGTESLVTNKLPEGIDIIILEDVITTGGSVIRALDVFKELKYNIMGVVVLIDRQQGGVETIQNDYNVPAISIFKKEDFNI